MTNTDRRTPRTQFIARVQNDACTTDYCFICRRPTDHWGEHSAKQIIAYAARNR